MKKYVMYVDTFMTRRQAIRTTASKPAQHGKMFRTISFARCVELGKISFRKWNSPAR